MCALKYYNFADKWLMNLERISHIGRQLNVRKNRRTQYEQCRVQFQTLFSFSNVSSLQL